MTWRNAPPCLTGERRADWDAAPDDAPPTDRKMVAMIVHLHTPMGRTYCNAPVPTDRARGLTAYASEATCPACIATLTPRQIERRAAREAEALAAREAHARDYAARYVAACEARDIAAGVLPALTRLAAPVQYAYAYSAAIGPCDGHGIHAACTIRD